MSSKAIKITDTTLRDGQQSLIATRMPTEQMLPILEKMDNAGFYAMEVWGGATYDACLRFLNEDPWERLDKIRALCKKTKLQMLYRGQNMLGYRSYSDDLVSGFLECAIDRGIDIIRVFDALNDPRNLDVSIKAINKAGGHAQVCISYTISEIHTIEYFVDFVKTLDSLGANSICIKDMAGLLVPSTATKLVKAIKEVTKLPLHIHCHCSSGLADITYIKAIEAGADAVDTAMSPFALGTSQPATEIIAEVLRDTEYDTGLDKNLLMEISDYFRPLREEAIASGLLDTKVLGVDIAALVYQVPGGMLSNLISQLKQQNAIDKFQDVLKEIPKVRADLGFPPLVTPTSQIVGTQAFLNVMAGERFKMVSNETKDIARGMYGQTPSPISDEIRKKIIGDEIPITVRPADLLEPEYETMKEEIKAYAESREDVYSYAMFPKVAEEFFRKRLEARHKIDLTYLENNDGAYPMG